MSKKYAICAAAAVAAGFAVPAISSAQSISSIYSNDVAGAVTITGTITSILDTTYSSSTYNTFTIDDGTGSILAYRVPDSVYTATVGDYVTVTASNAPYQDAPELSFTSSPTVVKISNVGAVAPNVLTIPQFNAAGNGSSTAYAPNAESYVELQNVYLPVGTTTLSTTSNTTYTTSDGPAGTGNTTALYDYKSYSGTETAAANFNTLEAANPAIASGPLDITGYVDVYDGEPEMYALSITPATPAPEPAMLGLMSILTVGLLSRRRRTA